MLAGCSDHDQQQQKFENYLWRLSNVLDQEYTTPVLPVIVLPEKRAIRLPIKEYSIDLLDFLAITGCRLQHIAGYKNSGLGRVMVDSQRLLYEYRFIEEAPACIESLQSSDVDLANHLSEILEQKKLQLPLHQWNAFWTSKEVRHYYGVSKQWLSTDQQLVLPESKVQTLMLVLNADAQTLPEIDQVADDFEEALGSFQYSNTAGEALITYQLVIEYLKQGSRMLETDKALTLCRVKPDGSLYISDKAQILHNVFLKFYIQDIQTYMSFLNREGSRFWQQQTEFLQATRRALIDMDTAYLDPALLTERFDPFAENYVDFQSDRSLWRQFHKELQRHTKAWQTVLSHCGLMPKAPGNL